MSEYIKREDVLRIMRRAFDFDYNEETAVENLPIADVVEVVRCKDCKWWTKQEDSLQGRCALMQSYPTGAWYCANGERESDE